MNVNAQFALLFLICMLGIAISALFPFPFPASVSSMIVMICLLWAGAVKLEHMKESADILLGNMALFFIPPAVGILAHVEALSGDLLKLIGICFLSTIMTVVATGLSVSLTVRLARRTGLPKGEPR